MSADSGGPAYVFDNSSEDETIGVALLSAEEEDGDSGDSERNGGESNLEISAVHGLGKASSFSCTVNLANTVVSPPIHVPLLQHCTLRHSSVRMSRMVIHRKKKKGEYKKPVSHLWHCEEEPMPMPMHVWCKLPVGCNHKSLKSLKCPYCPPPTPFTASFIYILRLVLEC